MDAAVDCRGGGRRAIGGGNRLSPGCATRFGAAMGQSRGHCGYSCRVRRRAYAVG